MRAPGPVACRDPGQAWSGRSWRDPASAEGRALDARLARGEGDVATLIARARHHVDVGEYEQALELAERAIEGSSGSGEAHYVRGLALGFLDRFEESDAAIARSQALGYSP